MFIWLTMCPVVIRRIKSLITLPMHISCTRLQLWDWDVCSYSKTDGRDVALDHFTALILTRVVNLNRLVVERWWGAAAVFTTWRHATIPNTCFTLFYYYTYTLRWKSIRKQHVIVYIPFTNNIIAHLLQAIWISSQKRFNSQTTEYLATVTAERKANTAEQTQRRHLSCCRVENSGELQTCGARTDTQKRDTLVARTVTSTQKSHLKHIFGGLWKARRGKFSSSKLHGARIMSQTVAGRCEQTKSSTTSGSPRSFRLQSKLAAWRVKRRFEDLSSEEVCCRQFNWSSETV